MIVRWKDTFFDLNRFIRAVPVKSDMHLSLSSPGGNSLEILQDMSPDEFEALIVAHADMLGHGPLKQESHSFSTPADWANVGRVGHEVSL